MLNPETLGLTVYLESGSLDCHLQCGSLFAWLHSCRLDW